MERRIWSSSPMKLYSTPITLVIATFLLFLNTVSIDEEITFDIPHTSPLQHFKPLEYLNGHASNSRYVPNDKYIRTIHIRRHNDYSGLVQKFNGHFENNQHFPTRPIPYPAFVRDYNVSYAFFKNIYVSWAQAIITPEHRYADTPFHWLPHIQGGTSGKVIYNIKKAFAPGHTSTVVFGHYVIDYMQLLLDFPEEVRKTYVMLNVPTNSYGNQGLDALGVPKENRIPQMKQGEIAFCEEVIYPFAPFVHCYHMGNSLHLLQQKVRDYLELDKIESNKHMLINRKVNRKWDNVVQLQEALQQAYPKYKWENSEDIYDFNEAAKLYASIRFLLTPIGSNAFHCIFMKEHSVIMTIAGYNFDWSFIGLAMHCRMHLIIYQCRLIQHAVSHTGANMDVKQFVYAAGFAIKYFETKKFPEEELNFNHV